MPNLMGAPFQSRKTNPPFDMTSVRLSGFWQAGNYTTSTPTWTSSPSAGDSGTRPPMVQWSTNTVPILGTALNTFAPADFTPDGGTSNTGQFLTDQSPTQLSGLVDSLGRTYTFGAVVKVRGASDISPEYMNALIFGDTNTYFCIMARNVGGTQPQAVLFQWDGAAKYVERNCSFNTYIAIWGTYDSGTGIMQLDAGGGIGTTSGVGPILNVGYSPWFGGVAGSGNASRRSNMVLADFAISRFAGEFTRAQYVSYANARYLLSLV